MNRYLASNTNRGTAVSGSIEAMRQLVTPLCLSKKLIVSNQGINLETYSGEYDLAPCSDLNRQRAST